MLTVEQRKLLNDLFALVGPKSDEAAKIFFERLFELEPSTRPLFRVSLDVQGKKLMDTLAYLAQTAGERKELLAKLHELGRGHASIGVEADHYAPVGSALHYALRKTLKDAFTLETEEAFLDAYTLFSREMELATTPRKKGD